jgi:hypothetical protein
MDVEGHIKPGDDFVTVLNAQVVATDVLLAVIGPRWSELLAERANDPDDFVAIEINEAAATKPSSCGTSRPEPRFRPSRDTPVKSSRQLSRRMAAQRCREITTILT